MVHNETRTGIGQDPLMSCEFPSLSFQREARRLIRSTLSAYLEAVEQTAMVSDVLIGARKDDLSGYVWNVLLTDLTFDTPSPAGAERLSECMDELHVALEPVLPVRVANVRPTGVPELLARCDDLHIQTVRLPIHASGV